ncbi:hypothetical protein PUN28_014704 [Cardiocondyla obscurior]|uniref:15-hydroxyprostaglandin dehydrogenase [NAD(+)] n=1 Tax=Cardiocondyla obscurior TaxID=286306 RepID=A0AAW2EW60_9HYME
MQIKDKRVIVTGAASGAGLAFSRELLRNGALMIIMIDIRQSHGEQAVESLNNEFGRKRAVFLYCDVTNNSEFDAAFKEAINILGGLDILINNAGVINETDFSEAIDVNVTAVIRGTLLGIQQMRKDSGGKGGVVVNISSIAGLQAVSQLPVYSATKHAVVSFSRSFAQPYHYQKSNVKVIVLCPGLSVDVSALGDLPQGVSSSDMLQIYQPQRVETIAHGLIYVIRCAQNGSVWISEDGKPVYEVQLPDTLPQKTEKVIILDIDEETGKRLVLGIEKSCGEKKVHFIHADVSNHKQMAEAFEEALSLLGSIDIVVNNAGVLDERRWEKEIAVNIGGMVDTAMLAMKYMSKDTGGNGGILVNVSQHTNVRHTAQLPVYNATKHAVIGLSQSLSDPYYYEKSGVTVITLCPGLTETALTIDSPNKLLSRVMKADFVKNLEQFSIQTPYVVAQGLMTILRIGESGSIWVIESGRAPYEVYVPNPRTLRRHYKNNFSHVEPKVARGRPIREVCDNTRTGLMSCA